VFLLLVFRANPVAGVGCRLLRYEDILSRDVVGVRDWNGVALLFCSVDHNPGGKQLGAQRYRLRANLVAEVRGGVRIARGLRRVRDADRCSRIFRHSDWSGDVLLPR
jgi:hypothetical protein